MIGMLGAAGAKPASALRNSGRIGSMIAVVGGHVDIDAPGQPIVLLHRRDHSIHHLGRSGDHRLARGGVDGQGHLGMVGDQRLGAGRVQFQQRHRTLPGQPRHQLRPGGDHPQSRRPPTAPRPPPPR